MARKGRIRKVSGVMLALLLAVGQLLMGGADVQAASKQKELNIIFDNTAPQAST